MSKYLSHKTVVDGIKFDSKDEAKYYESLKIRKYRGEIENFDRQGVGITGFVWNERSLFLVKLGK